MVRQNAMLARNILGEATWLIGMGTALGIIGAVIDAMLMRRLLFGVQVVGSGDACRHHVRLTISALVASYISPGALRR